MIFQFFKQKYQVHHLANTGNDPVRKNVQTNDPDPDDDWFAILQQKELRTIICIFVKWSGTIITKFAQKLSVATCSKLYY